MVVVNAAEKIVKIAGGDYNLRLEVRFTRSLAISRASYLSQAGFVGFARPLSSFISRNLLNAWP